MNKIVAALLVSMFSNAALAEQNPLQFDDSACMLDSTGALSLSTLAMPKGWFNSKNTLDRTKTEIRVTAVLDSTSCVVGAGEQTFSSATLGSFLTGYLPVLNPQSKDVGYVWTMLGDLAAAQNHWNFYTGCDGKKVVVGCPQARGTSFTVEAFEPKSGACRSYLDATNVLTCAKDTIAFQLAAVQDPDVVETDCGVTGDPCGIGQCVSARTNDGGICDQTYPVLEVPKERGNGTYDANADDRKKCINSASCFCKQQLPATCSKTCE